MGPQTGLAWRYGSDELVVFVILANTARALIYTARASSESADILCVCFHGLTNLLM